MRETKKPHHMAVRLDAPCPRCGSEWGRPEIRVDPKAETFPELLLFAATFHELLLCAACKFVLHDSSATPTPSEEPTR